MASGRVGLDVNVMCGDVKKGRERGFFFGGNSRNTDNFDVGLKS